MTQWLVNLVGAGRPLRRLLLAAAGLCIAMGITGCGGSGGGSRLPVFVPGSVSSTDRAAAYTEVGSFFETVYGHPDAAKQIVAKMKTMHQFAAAEISKSGDAVAWFTDGRLYVCITSDPVIPATPARLPTVVPPSSKVRHDLTASPNAFLINAFEPMRPDVTPILDSILTDQGYNVVRLSGTVTDYQKISNAGLLFVHAHGVVSTDTFNFPRFWYSTSEAPSDALDATYDSYWTKGTIAVGEHAIWQPDGSIKSGETYLISDQFLHDSGITFAKNSVWISQSCTSFNPYLLNAIFDPSLGFPGVAVYGGWTDEEDSFQATATTSFLFDRLLGLNQVAPVDPADPPPADFKKLAALLATTIRPLDAQPYGTSTIKNTTAFLKFQARPLLSGVSAPTIIPAITDTVADATNQSLSINGFFGAPTGTITLNGTPLTVRTWSETSVVVDLPAASTGTLVAKSLGIAGAPVNLLSNPFNYIALQVAITPPGGTLQHSQHQTYSVAATAGTIPAGSKYRWILTGQGSLSGVSPQVTTSSSVNYAAPSEDSADSLKVEVLSSTGKVMASAIATISVGSQSIAYTVTGDTSGESFLTDGTFNQPFFTAFHYGFPSQDNGVVEFWNHGTGSRMDIVLTKATGTKFTLGQTFTYGANKVNGFRFSPGLGNTTAGFSAASGNMTITSVSDNGDGTFTIGFSGSATDFLGCQIVASGSFIFHYNYDTIPG